MAKRIAVAEGLDNVKQALRREGFQVTKLSPGTMSGVSAAVVTGMSEDIMGIEDTNGNKFPVIEANGMTADEVISQIRARAGEP